MARQTDDHPVATELEGRSSERIEAPQLYPSRTEALAAVLDHCSRAQSLAEAQGEKLLCYLFAMAIEETRNAIRRTAELMDQ